MYQGRGIKKGHILCSPPLKMHGTLIPETPVAETAGDDVTTGHPVDETGAAAMIDESRGCACVLPTKSGALLSCPTLDCVHRCTSALVVMSLIYTTFVMGYLYDVLDIHCQLRIALQILAFTLLVNLANWSLLRCIRPCESESEVGQARLDEGRLETYSVAANIGRDPELAALERIQSKDMLVLFKVQHGRNIGSLTSTYPKVIAPVHTKSTHAHKEHMTSLPEASLTEAPSVVLEQRYDARAPAGSMTSFSVMPSTEALHLKERFSPRRLVEQSWRRRSRSFIQNLWAGFDLFKVVVCLDILRRLVVHFSMYYWAVGFVDTVECFVLPLACIMTEASITVARIVQ